MAATAKKTDPALWERIKHAITEGDRGGKPGQWSARKAQLAVQDYKKQGGGYSGGKDAGNHLRQWTEQTWDTKSGEKSGKTGERYLPKRAREQLTAAEYNETTAKKRADTRTGKQFSAQPPAIARKTAKARDAGNASSKTAPALAELTRPQLVARAAEAGVQGRSRMSKDQLVKALDRWPRAPSTPMGKQRFTRKTAIRLSDAGPKTAVAAPGASSRSICSASLKRLKNPHR